MKILLIGGRGGVGSKIAQLLPFDVIQLNSQQFPLPLIPNLYQDAEVVVNMAAITTDCTLDKYDILTRRIIEVNCLGSVNILAHFLPHMRKRKYGRIIFMSSIYSDINVKGQGVYSASKAFVDKLVKVAALENAEYGITVNSIQLGYTGLGMGDVNQALKERAKSKVALKRFVYPEEIADTIKYIIDTEYVTGQNLKLDGFTK